MAYPLDVGIGASWFGRRRQLFPIRAGGMLESNVEFYIKGEWTYLADTWLEARSLDTLFATGLLV